MVLPIYVYGCPVLRKVAEEIDEDFEGLDKLLEDMHDTMVATEGVGLAAPQIGKSIRVMIIDASPFEEEEPKLADFQRVMINPEILELKGEPFTFNEGCLSVPGIREDVSRESVVTVEYYNENWELITETLSGTAGRIVQHEYDHLEGKLFIDHLPLLRKKLLKRRLMDISKGKTKINYRIKTPTSK